MFDINEYVIYGSEGVCVVESIGHPAIAGLDASREYYTLSPVYRTGKIYTPVDSTIRMRKALTKEEAQKVIDGIEQISCALDVPRDNKLANLFYKELITSYECEKLISIIKYVFLKQREFLTIKKNMPAVDLKYCRIAEDMLYNEFGFALGISPKDVKGYILKCCEG